MSGVPEGGADLLFVTLTAPGDDRLPTADRIEWWNRGAADRWTRFVGLVRAKFPGARVEYGRAFELQRRGAVHPHVIFRGLPLVPWAVLQPLAVAAGFGPVGDAQSVAQVHGVASYLGSYLAKSRTAFPKGARVFGTSRAWRIGWVKRRTVAGRYLSGPVGGMTWWEWAGALIDAGYGVSDPPGARCGTWEPPPGLFDA